jgi:2-methylcitrate dehydratase PrpD
VRVVGYARSQVVSTLAAARTGLAHPLGRALVQACGPPLQDDPSRTAYALAAQTPWLRLDDVAFAGHLSNSTVTVAVAHALAHGLDGRALLAAVVAADECAARVTAATTLGPLRGQSAAHTHLVGAVAARSHCESASDRTWTDALAIALSTPTWPGLRGFLGSDANLLSAAQPVRTGLDACDAAAAGLRGVPDVLEHADGFLARFADVPLPELVTAGLGTRWHTDTLSFRVRPGGPGLDAAVDCTRALHADLQDEVGPLDPDDVEELVVTTSLYGVLVGGQAAAQGDGPHAPVSALVLSTPYGVATALLTGDLTGADYASPALDDPRRWALAAKVRVQADEAMTRASLRCGVPFGEALRTAGPRALPWLRRTGGDRLVALVGDLGPPAEGYEQVERTLPARVSVRLRGGRVLERERAVPEGAAGPATAATHGQLVREKLLRTGAPAVLADRLERLEQLDHTELADVLRALLG